MWEIGERVYADNPLEPGCGVFVGQIDFGVRGRDAQSAPSLETARTALITAAAIRKANMVVNARFVEEDTAEELSIQTA